jgi:hypothetical protein
MEVCRRPFDPSNLPWAVSQCPFDPYRAGAKVYRAYRTGGRPAPQTTLIVGTGRRITKPTARCQHVEASSRIERSKVENFMRDS